MPSAASAVLAGLLDGAVTLDLVEVARTRVSVHFETSHPDVPVLCVSTPDAVHLPNSVLAPVLPTGAAALRAGVLVDTSSHWQVVRWWQPPRPRGLVSPVSVVAPGGVDTLAAVTPQELIGRGPGLTPAGDDVLAGALVAAHAVADDRLPHWRAATRDLIAAHRTTAVSRGLLHHALDGWSTHELADFLTAVCAGDMTVTSRATERLLRVGHSSGAALASGALHVLGSHRAVAAA